MTPLNKLAIKAAKSIVSSGDAEAFAEQNNCSLSGIYKIAKGEIQDVRTSTAYKLIKAKYPNLAKAISKREQAEQEKAA